MDNHVVYPDMLREQRWIKTTYQIKSLKLFENIIIPFYQQKVHSILLPMNLFHNNKIVFESTQTQLRRQKRTRIISKKERFSKEFHQENSECVLIQESMNEENDLPLSSKEYPVKHVSMSAGTNREKHIAVFNVWKKI